MPLTPLSLQSIVTSQIWYSQDLSKSISLTSSSVALNGSSEVLGTFTVKSGYGLYVKNSDNTKNIGLWHDGTNATVGTASGRLLLSASDVTQNVSTYVGGLPVIQALGVASAVNYINVTNAATGVSPKFTAAGETNVGLDIYGKGTTGRIRLFPDGTHHIDQLYDGANLLVLPSVGLYIYSADQSKAVIVGNTGITISGILTTTASASGSSGLNLPHGAAPSAPINGDMWSTTAGLFIRINGVTKTVTLT